MTEDESQRIRESGQLPRTDNELVRNALHGDADALHGLVDRFGPYLYRLAATLVGNAADAEDLLQETLAGAFRRLRSFRRQSSVKTWLTSILIRQVASHFRRKSLRAALGWRVPPQTATPAANPSDVRMDVQSAVLALRPEFREVIVLREMHGLSYDEISQALGIPRGTVESRLFRARRELQESLKGYLG